MILYLGYPDGVSNRISGYILVFFNKLVFNNNYFLFYYNIIMKMNNCNLLNKSLLKVLIKKKRELISMFSGSKLLLL